MAFTIDATRTAKIELASTAGSIGELITDLIAIRDRPAVGPDSVIRQLSGGGKSFIVVLVKPD